MRTMMITTAIAILFVASPARAKTITLNCNVNGEQQVLTVDFSNKSVCDEWDLGGMHCFPFGKPSPATITERTIRFELSKSGTVTIDRITGNITWANGSPGTCSQKNF